MLFRRRAAVPIPALTYVVLSAAGGCVAPLAAVRWRTALAATVLGIGLAHAQDGSNEQDKANLTLSGDAALLKKLEQMEQRIRTLERQLKQRDTRPGEGARADGSRRPHAHGHGTVRGHRHRPGSGA